MMILFIAVATGVLVGTFLLWLSGYYTGQAVSAAPDSNSMPQAAPNTEALDALRQQLTLSEQNAVRLETELNEAVAAAATAASNSQASSDTSMDAEIAKLNSALARAEGERDKALVELDNIKDDLEKATLELQKKPSPSKPKTLPKPKKRNSNPILANELFDEIQAALDIEKASHQQTRDEMAAILKSKDDLTDDLERVKRELEQVKKLAAVKTAATTSAEPQKGSRFKTMALGMRSPVAGGADQDLLRVALNKVQTEKDRIESELERAKKEIQLLKMRS